MIERRFRPQVPGPLIHEILDAGAAQQNGRGVNQNPHAEEIPHSGGIETSFPA
jgi:hypothetical protein